MYLCPKAQKIKADFEQATEGFLISASSFAAKGDEARAKAQRHQASGSKQVMARHLNNHMQRCRLCG